MSNPLEIVVYIGGVRVGNTPLITYDVPAGTHKIRFEKIGYNFYAIIVSVEKNSNRTVEQVPKW